MLRAKCSRFQAERPDQKREEKKKENRKREKTDILLSRLSFFLSLSFSLPSYFSQFLITKHGELSRCSKRSNLVDVNDDLHDLSDT